MGASKSGGELVAKLLHAADHIDDAARAGVTKSALFTKTAVVAELHGVNRLRGVGKRGAKIGVRYDLLRSGSGVKAVIKMTGPAQLLERDTARHEIGPKKGHQAIRLGNGGIRRSVFHPGTKGKHPFEKGVAVAAPKVPAVMMAEQVKQLRNTFS